MSRSVLSVIDRLRDFIESEFLSDEGGRSLEPDDDLLEEGILDSIVIFQVVHFMEKTYGIRIEDQEITLENFRNVSSMGRLVERRLEDAG